MRLIPVIDLLDDQAVHAIKGTARSVPAGAKRSLRHIRSAWRSLRAFRDRLKLHEIYIADLNAIQGFSRTRHQSLILEIYAASKECA